MLKNNIIRLYNEGFSYNDISKLLNCSKGTIAYHLNPKVKQKVKENNKKNKKHPYIKKIHGFNRPNSKIGTVGNIKLQDVISKFSTNPTCYLTGKEIDIEKTDTYSFDHIFPRSKGGNSDLNNCQIATYSVNMAKRDMVLDEFLKMCADVVIHNKEYLKPYLEGKL